MSNKYKSQFEDLDSEISNFLTVINEKKLTDMATIEWQVKDVLGHIVFWHEYYANQYKALAEGREPFYWKSLVGVNKIGKKTMRNVSKHELLSRLERAQKSLKRSILDKKVPKMRYIASREYTTSDFLDVVIGHIKRHTIQMRRAKSRVIHVNSGLHLLGGGGE